MFCEYSLPFQTWPDVVVGAARSKCPDGTAGAGEDTQQGHPFSCSLPYTANADISMEACCTEGNQMANQHRDCSLPYTSESKECRYACCYYCLT